MRIRGGGGANRPHRGLDRATVVRAALSSIDRHGAQGLTMRGLGQELGVEAMSLYHYVTGREDVLEAVVTSLLDNVTDRLDEDLSQTWQGYLQTLAHTIRDIALAHPRAFPLVATRHPSAPWLRPPLRSLEVVEDFLTTLGGFAFQRRPGGGRVPLVQQFPARAPVAGGGAARGRDVARSRNRSTRGAHRSPTGTGPSSCRPTRRCRGCGRN